MDCDVAQLLCNGRCQGDNNRAGHREHSAASCMTVSKSRLYVWFACRLKDPILSPRPSLFLSPLRRTSSRLVLSHLCTLSRARRLLFKSILYLQSLPSLALLFVPLSTVDCPHIGPFAFHYFYLTSSQFCRHSSYTSNVTLGFSNCKVHPVSFPVSEIRSAVFLLFRSLPLSLSLFSVSSLSLAILQTSRNEQSCIYVRRIAIKFPLTSDALENLISRRCGLIRPR